MNIKTVKAGDVKNNKYHFIGAVFIILNYLRHRFFRYKTPRAFSVNEIERSIDYDFKVVDSWIEYLRFYSKDEKPLTKKVVLELGPGPDFGAGLILLALGAKKYIALDVNKLAFSSPVKFYEKLFERLKERYTNCNIEHLKETLSKCYKNEYAEINYIIDKSFAISKIKEKVDVVFSQAAFEHFTDVEKTFIELSNVVNQGGVLVALIDLKTHTSWIRDRDPLNIYRYCDWFWNTFKFKGSPNRVRVFEYKDMLEKKGWVDVKVEPVAVVEEEYLKKVKPRLNKKFRNMDSSEMKTLGFLLMARKK
ncbi:methyltransferase domain-containing protein [Candidatus Kuenenia sp.]|uniref:methyltransferase domain-containing protein n=1 Tax=Candidatus Kuenenia sp. TaxID=2499824 RepID=UPI0032205491